jgi:hypothetical protein
MQGWGHHLLALLTLSRTLGVWGAAKERRFWNEKRQRIQKRGDFELEDMGTSYSSKPAQLFSNLYDEAVTNDLVAA